MKKILVVIFAAVIIMTACQPQAEGPRISVQDAWGRPSPSLESPSAFYMVIRNDGGEADRLLRVESEACGAAEIHESYMMDNGTMGMRPVEGGLEIPAGGMVELAAGGLHVMCMQRTSDFAVGYKYPLFLIFEKSGTMQVEVEVREQP